jgi:hypothetical protein
VKFILLFAASLVFASPVLAEDYEKGPNGGLMLDVAGIDAELLTSGTAVTINVFNASSPTPLSTKGYTAAVLITTGAGRELVSLAPAGENSLNGEARSPIGPGTTVTLTIKTSEGKSGQVKYKTR